MPVYQETNRRGSFYRFISYDDKGKITEDRTIWNSNSNGDGYVRRFDGPNEGRFIPGQYRVNSMTASRTTYVYGSGEIRGRQIPNGLYSHTVSGKWSQGIQPRFVLDDSWDSSLTGYAVQRAYSSLLSSDLDMGEFLAELPSTISMVREGIISIRKAISSAKSRGFTWRKAARALALLRQKRSLKTVPRGLANAWLLWRYGIRPLIWDVQGIIKEANEFALQSNFSGLRRKRGRAEKSSQYSYDYITQGPLKAGLRRHAKEYVDVRKRAEATVYYKYGSSFGATDFILLKYGLHPMQIPYLLWQVVPLSFMLDWFVDVGTWIRAITPKWSFEILGCSVSQKTILTSNRIVIGESNIPAHYEVSGTPITDRFTVESINRRAQTLPGEIPRLKPQIILSIQQQADLLSVLLQRVLNNRRH